MNYELRKNKIRVVLAILMVYSLFLIPDSSLAQSRFINCEPSLAPAQGGCGIPAFIQFIKNVITFLLQLAFPLAAIFIIYGAFVIITAGGSQEKVKTGRGIIFASVIGLAIALGSWLIVTTIFKLLPVAPEFIPK